MHERVPDAGVEDHDRRDDREDVRGVGRDRGDRVLAPEERRGDQRLAQPALLPARLLHEEALELVRHVGRAARGRLVDDARALEQHVGERAVVAERGLAAEERLRLPARQHLEQAVAAVGREAAGRAGHGAEDRLRALDHAEGHEVAHLLQQREHVVGAVLHVGVAGHGGHAAVAERLDDLAQRVGLERRVRVDEADDLRVGRADAGGHRRALAAVVREADRVQVREAPRGERHALPGRVGRAVVDREHREQVLRVVEREDRGERRLDRRLLVHGRDHDGDGRQLVRPAAHRVVEQREAEAREQVDGHAEAVEPEERVEPERGQVRALDEPDDAREQQEVAAEQAAPEEPGEEVADALHGLSEGMFHVSWSSSPRRQRPTPSPAARAWPSRPCTLCALA